MGKFSSQKKKTENEHCDSSGTYDSDFRLKEVISTEEEDEDVDEDEDEDEEEDETEDEDEEEDEEEDEDKDEDVDDVEDEDEDDDEEEGSKEQEINHEDEDSDEQKRLSEKMRNISVSIEALPDSERSKCSTNNQCLLDVISATKLIRERCNPDEYEKLKEEMITFSKDETMINAFANFRQICQFVMYMHQLYEVPLYKDPSENLDVVDVMVEILGKYTN